MSTTRIRPAPDLPPLEQILPGFPGLESVPSRSHALLRQLRQLALRLRCGHHRRFYSTREVARFFRVDPELARRAFAELQREGIVTRLRSSMTLLQPSTKRTRTHVRGVVGLPVWLYGHSAIADWQFFYRRMEEHLRRHGFVGDFIFYGMREPDDPAFLDRLIEHDLDVLLWFHPLPSYRTILHSVADAGIQPVVLAPPPETWSCPTYAIRQDRAVRTGLAAWRAAGITTVAFFGYAGDLQFFSHWIDECGLTLMGDQPFSDLTPALLRRVAGKRQVGVLVGSDLWLANALTLRRREILRLLREAHCLLVSPPACGPGELTGVTADTAYVDWERTAARIAADLAGGTLPPVTAPAVIDAVYRRDVRGEALTCQHTP